MYAGQVDVEHIVGGIAVLDLSASPVETFDFHSLAILDGDARRDCEKLAAWSAVHSPDCISQISFLTIRMPAILLARSAGLTDRLNDSDIREGVAADQPACSNQP